MQIQFSSRTSNLQKIELCSLVPTPLRCGLEARAACKYGDIIYPLLAGQWMDPTPFFRLTQVATTNQEKELVAI